MSPSGEFLPVRVREFSHTPRPALLLFRRHTENDVASLLCRLKHGMLRLAYFGIHLGTDLIIYSRIDIAQRKQAVILLHGLDERDRTVPVASAAVDCFALPRGFVGAA